jgi:hypothetical protein
VTSTREPDRFAVVYHVEQDRDIRYTYTYASTPSQLIVDVQLLERGTGDKARRIYEPGVAVEPRAASGSAAPTGAAAPRSLPATPSGPGPTKPEALDQRPGAELRGLTSLGVLVEELGAQAVACGLGRDAIDSAISRHLTDAGFTVRKNTDDDTYVYVNIITNRLPDGSCASRYDAFLYTYATATLSHHDRPVLAQVSLMHRGGLDINRPPAHAAAVVRDLTSYVDLFVTQVRDAGR